MAHCEVDSFVEKFKHLWHAGIKATLKVEAVGGEASITLTTGLGHIPPPPPLVNPLPPNGQYSGCYRRGPSYQRRQERRKAARVAAAAVQVDVSLAEEAINSSTAVSEEAVALDRDSLAEEAIDSSAAVSEEAVALDNESPSQEVNEKVAGKAADKYPCLLCDFDSNWKNGLEIHMTRKHSQMVQLDGNITFDSVELEEDVKYENTSHYWKHGRLGIMYQTFLDANLIIDNSNLSEEKKIEEKSRILAARKSAFGDGYKQFPPWDKM